MRLKFKRKHDLSGKYAILLSESRTKYAAVLKFISRKLCKAKAAVTVSNNTIKQISPKFVISPRRNKKILRKIEVIVTKQFKAEYEGLRSAAKTPSKERTKTISPIKIFSCTTCNHKFTSKPHFEAHVHTHKDLDSSSDSEGGLVIDDDVMLVLEDDSDDFPAHPAKILNLKEHPGEAKAEEFCCMVENCQKKFDSEQALVLHIGLCHIKDDRPFKCNKSKCLDSFKRESGLIAHQRMCHPIELIPPKSLEPPKRGRRKSVFVPSPIDATALEPKNKSPVNSSITFKLYDSTKKTTFICRICSASFEQRTFLDRHISVHHIAKMYHCFKCMSAFTMIKLLEHIKIAHMDLVHDENYIRTISDVNSVASHRCAFCRYSSRIRSEVNEHMKDEHYDEFEKSENPEDDHASSPDSLENLLMPESARIISRKEEQLAKNQLMKVKTSLKKRRPTNDPSFQFRCVRCQRRFAKSETLRRHTCYRHRKELPSSESPTLDQFNNHDTPKTSQTRFTANSQMVNGFFNCLLCPQVFTDRTMFAAHVSTGHLSSQNRPKSSANGFYNSIN